MAYKNKTISNPYSGQSIRFIQTSDDTDGALLEMESNFAPHSKEPVPHFHPKQEEQFTVLAGTINIRLNGRIVHLHKGEALTIAPNTIHSMWNDSNETAVVNWKVMPALSTEYLLETGMGLAADGKVTKNGMPCFLQSVLIAEKYNAVFRLAKPSYKLQKVLFRLVKPLSRLKGYKAVYTKYID